MNMNNKNNIQPLEETARAVERMADRMVKMDKAEAASGEVMSDDDLDDVAGGNFGKLFLKIPE